MSSDLLTLKVKDLKEKCKALGLPVSGTKANLISRIQAKIEATSDTPLQAPPDLQNPLPITRKQAKRPAERNENLHTKAFKAIQKTTPGEFYATNRSEDAEGCASPVVHNSSSEKDPPTDHRNSTQHDTAKENTISTLESECYSSKVLSTTPIQNHPEQKSLSHGTFAISRESNLHGSLFEPQNLSPLAKQATETAKNAIKLCSASKVHHTNNLVSITAKHKDVLKQCITSAKHGREKTIVRFLPKTNALKSSTGTIVPPSDKANCRTRLLDKDIASQLLRDNYANFNDNQLKRLSTVFALIVSCANQDHEFAGGRTESFPSIVFLKQLLDMHFPGRRTEVYKQKFPSSLYDLSLYYLHRLSERSEAVAKLKNHWVERVWSLLISNGVRDMNTMNSCEVVFTGIRKGLLYNPDCDAQIDVALKFWIQRFTYYTNGGASKGLITALQNEQVMQATPVLLEGEILDQTSEATIWKIETLDNGVYFVVCNTGEVIGWRATDKNNAQDIIQNTHSASFSRKRSLTRMSSSHTSTSQPSTTQRSKTNDLSWNDLRQDWRHFIEVGQESLTDFIYCPKPSTFSKGIHKSIRPPQLSVAQAFVLTHVMASGISGTPLFEVSYQGTHDTNHKNIPNKIQLDLDAKYAVESVKCSGESHTALLNESGRGRKVLAAGIAIIQTPEIGYFVLEETGQEIGDVEHGIQNMWCTILGVDEQGHALEKQELQELDKCFHFAEDSDDS